MLTTGLVVSTVKVLLAAVLIDALHAPLEDREVALDGVGVDDATHVLASGMAYSAVLPAVKNARRADCAAPALPSAAMLASASRSSRSESTKYSDAVALAAPLAQYSDAVFALPAMQAWVAASAAEPAATMPSNATESPKCHAS